MNNPKSVSRLTQPLWGERAEKSLRRPTMESGEDGVTLIPEESIKVGRPDSKQEEQRAASLVSTWRQGKPIERCAGLWTLKASDVLYPARPYFLNLPNCCRISFCTLWIYFVLIGWLKKKLLWLMARQNRAKWVIQTEIQETKDIEWSTSSSHPMKNMPAHW